MNILSYTFFQNALAGSLLASMLCGIVALLWEAFGQNE